MKNTVIYIKQTFDGIDKELKLKKLQDYATQYSLEIVTVYQDELSRQEIGFQFQKLMQMAEEKEFSNVLLFELNDISDNFEPAIKFLLRLNNLGVSVHCVGEPLLFEPGNNASMKIISQVWKMIQTERRSRIRAAIKKSRTSALERNENFRWGRPSVRTPEIVQRVLELDQKGHSVRAIERILQNSISRSTVNRIIQSEKHSAVEQLE